jgi:hypothetical protein
LGIAKRCGNAPRFALSGGHGGASPAFQDMGHGHGASTGAGATPHWCASALSHFFPHFPQNGRGSSSRFASFRSFIHMKNV